MGWDELCLACLHTACSYQIIWRSQMLLNVCWQCGQDLDADSALEWWVKPILCRVHMYALIHIWNIWTRCVSVQEAKLDKLHTICTSKSWHYLHLETWLYGDYCNVVCLVTTAFDMIGIDTVVELCYLSDRLQLSGPKVTVSHLRLYTVIIIGFMWVPGTWYWSPANSAAIHKTFCTINENACSVL